MTVDSNHPSRHQFWADAIRNRVTILKAEAAYDGIGEVPAATVAIHKQNLHDTIIEYAGADVEMQHEVSRQIAHWLAEWLQETAVSLLANEGEVAFFHDAKPEDFE